MPAADRTRLAARVPADYPGFGYAPLLPDDMKAVANIANDLAAGSPEASANQVLIAADRAQTRLDQIASSTSASAAAGMVAVMADRVAGRGLNNADLWGMLRASPSWGFGPDGSLVETAADTLPWEYNATTQAPLGVVFAGARSNVHNNPRAEGAVPGTPGTRPTGWSALPSGAPTIECLGQTTRRGVPGVLYRFSGVPTTAAGQQWGLNGSKALTIGQVVCTTVFIELVAGSLTNVVNFSLRSDLGESGTTFTPGAFARVARVWTSTGSSATPGLRWGYGDTVTAVDFTLFIGAPSIEINAPFPSSPILPPVGTPGVSTRAQGSVSIPVRDLGVSYNRRQGVIIVEWSSLPGGFSSPADADAFGLISLGDTTGTQAMALVVNRTHTLVDMLRVVGGAVQSTASCSMTAPAAGQSIRCAMAWDVDAGLVQVAARGAVGTQLTGQFLLPNITHIMPGRYSTSRPLFGWISGVEIRPAAAFGATLAGMT